MTGAINKIKSPNQFLMKLLYSDHRPQSTEVIEIDSWVKGRQMAPFVKKNSNAIPVEGPSQERVMVEAPNIRISRNVKPHELMFGRTPGSVIFPSSGNQRSAIQEHMAKELQPLADDIANTEEWMASQTLTGVLTYAVDSGDNFTITYQRPADPAALTGDNAWTNGASDPLGDIHAAKRTMSEEGFMPTDAILGAGAADAFLANTDLRAVMDVRNMSAGSMTFVEQFSDDGVIFLGSVAGVRFWEYNRSVTDLTGTSVKLIRNEYAEFVDTSASSEFVMYYGAIPDMDALNGRSWVGERFSKSKVTFDPSSITALVHSRPLPVVRRPEATYSLKVIA